MDYIGRFAPSPTGPLHAGSMLAAMASYADARHHGGKWLVRIEDIDAPRAVKGAAQQQLHTLAQFGMTSDVPVVYQQKRHALYQQALDQLSADEQCFPCACTRKQLPANRPYPGTCRSGLPTGTAGRAIRLKTNTERISFQDRVLGPQSESLAETCGDFVIRRADALFAYQLVVVVDDALQQVTHIVRGADLLESTARQIWLQSCLGYKTPQYAHIPLLLDESGHKLSKQNKALPVTPENPLATLGQLWNLLGQPEIHARSVAHFWRQAAEKWSIQAVPKHPVSMCVNSMEHRNDQNSASEQ